MPTPRGYPAPPRTFRFPALAGGEAPAIHRKHAEIFLALAEAGAAALEGAEQGAWLGRLQQEHDNLRAALGWALDQREAAIGLRLATALRLLWFMRSYLMEGREQLAQALALDPSSAFQLPPLLRLPLIRWLPLVRELPMRVIAFGIRREHVARELRDPLALTAPVEM